MSATCTESDCNSSTISFQFMIAIYSSVLLLAGTVGNLASMYILIMKLKLTTRSIVIMSLICLPETIVLYTWNLNYIYRELIRRQSNANMEELSLVHCKLISYIAYTSLQCSAWFRCYLCVNRWLCVQNVGTCKEWKTRSAFITCGLLTIICMMVNIHVLVHNGYLITANNNSSELWQIAKGELNLGTYNRETIEKWSKYLSTKKIRCYARRNHYSYFDPAWASIHYILYSFIPAIIMMSFDLSLLMTIRRGIIPNTGKRRNLESISQTIMGMDFVFILCSLPSASVHTILDRAFLKGNPYRKVIKMIVASMDNTLHATLFALYMILLKPFRQIVIEFLFSSSSS